MGHTCSIWIEEPSGDVHVDAPAVLRHNINEWFTPVRAPVYTDFSHWHGADVVIATGWETAHRCALLEGVKARAYLVQDHEPEFFADVGAADLGRRDLRARLLPDLRQALAARPARAPLRLRRHVVPARRRPRDLLPAARDAAPARHRDLLRAPRHRPPRGAARPARPERAARSQRAGTRAVLFGDAHPLPTSFPYTQLGVATPGQLAEAYAEATVGICLSTTNYSLIPQEMMACGLPCVDLAGSSSEAIFGADGPVALAEADPVALANAVADLLDDEDAWRSRAEAGLEYVATAEWDEAGRRVELGLREALRRRESAVVR